VILHHVVTLLEFRMFIEKIDTNAGGVVTAYGRRCDGA
jgi:hypothetical protein